MNTRSSIQKTGARLAVLATACAAMAFSAGAAAQTRELGSSGQLLDGVAAVVEDGVVLKSELQQNMQNVVDNYRQQQLSLPPEQRSQLPPASVIEQQVLDQLIIEEIQLQRANRLGITVGDDELNQALTQVAQNLGLTLQELPEALAAQNIDYTAYREESRESLIVNQLEQRDVISRISVTPRELEQCLIRTEAAQTDEFDYNVSHILIGLPGSASNQEIAQAQERIEDIQRRLEQGEDFAQLALTYSEAPTALESGSLGWRKGSELPTVFADVVIDMEPGEYSDPIQTGSGFHIVKLNEMRGAERVMIDQLRVRHILLTPNEILDDAATEQKLIGIRNQIADGDEFATVAQAVSEDTVSAADGGDLGWVQPGEFVPEFEERLAALEVGQLSEPFRTRYGWHIAEVTDQRNYDTTDELKEQRCQREIRESKAQEEREIWVRRLRDQAYVDVRI